MNIETHISRSGKHRVQPTDWGKLVWQVSGNIGNSEQMTVGVCYIDPGRENDRHLHPNCEEVLVVRSGRIVHTLGDQESEMGIGDIIVIPAGVAHHARNIGAGVAELGICYSNANRLTELEQRPSA